MMKVLRKKETSQAFSLGLKALPEDYKQLHTGAIYWVATSQQKEAVWVVQQTLSDAAVDSRVILLGDTHLDEILSYVESRRAEPLAIRSNQLKENTERSFLLLPKKISRMLKGSSCLVVLLIDVEQGGGWLKSTAPILVAWRDYLAKRGSTLLIVSYGSNYLDLTQALYPENELLSGLAVLNSVDRAANQTSPDAMSYYVQHWRNRLGVKPSTKFMIQQDATGPVASQSLTLESLFSNAKIIMQQSIIQDSISSQRKEYEFVNTWDELVERGLTEVAAVLVFALHTHQELTKLARLFFELRLQRQQALQLVVVEVGQYVLRQKDIELLTLCGASLVIPKINTFRIFNLLEVLSSQPSNYQLTDDLDKAIALHQPQLERGVLSILDFIGHLNELVDLLDEQDRPGSLVILKPASMLSAVQLLSQIKLKREGDIACVTQHAVYVFLFGCDEAQVVSTLNRIMRLPLAELVLEHRVFTIPEAIKTQLQHLQMLPEPKLEAPEPVFEPGRRPLFTPSLEPLFLR